MKLYDSEQDNVPGFDPRAEKYVRLDLDRWLKKHAVLEKAKEQGKANQPPSDATSLDATELEIVDWINHRGRKCREDVVRHLSDFERDLVHMENDQELVFLKQKVRQAEKNAELKLERTVRGGRNDLSTTRDDVSTVRQDFQTFVEQARLTRLPDYSHRSSSWMIIGVCVLFEIVLNAMYLSGVMEAGLLGAIGQMALISGINVLLFGLAMGELLRLTNHVQWTRKIVSWLAIGLLVLPMVAVFNLGVGHYRDSVQAILTGRSADVFQQGAEALQRLIDSPFGLESFDSVLLVLLGIACFAVASWKWLRTDDVYPEYGHRDRQLKRTEKDYVQKYDRIQSGLDRIYQDFESKLEDIRHQLLATQSKWREICGRGARLVEEYAVNLEQYQHDLDYLLTTYRTANETVRTTPVPAHFPKLERVDEAILQPPSFSPPVGVSIQDVMGQVHDTIRHLQGLVRAASGHFAPLDEIGNERLQKDSGRS